MGNLDFKADADDIFQSIRPFLKKSGIRHETTTVPLRKGGNRGYGFIGLSWERDAPVDPRDILTTLSGRIKVISRLVYLCETNDTSTTSSTDRSESEHDTSSASSANLSESDNDTSYTSSADRSDSDNDASTASESSERDRSESVPEERIKAYLATAPKQTFPFRSFRYDSDGDSVTY